MRFGLIPVPHDRIPERMAPSRPAPTEPPVKSKKEAFPGDALFGAPSLFGGLLLDGELAAVETALGAYAVVQHGCTAVRTGHHRRNDSLVMSSALVASRRRDFVFRMCHFTV